MSKMKMGVALALALALGAIVAQRITAQEKGDEGWIRLFDGQTLKGWKANELAENWKVVDGAIRASGPRSHLFYVGADEKNPQEFQNFHFKAEVKTTPGSNSGIFFHSKFQDSGWPEIGYECQVNNTHGDPVKTGSIYYVVKNFKQPAEDNAWFAEEIIVEGKHIQTRVNGVVVVDYTEPEGVQGPHKLSKGLFALQAHDPASTTFYRNIMVKPLPSSGK